MRSRVLLCAVASLAVLGFANAAWAKGSLSEALAELDEEQLIKTISIRKGARPDRRGQGTVPYLAKLDAPPQRVALVSFYIFDSGSANNSPVYRYAIGSQFVSLTADGASHFAQKLHDQGIDALKAAFAEHGMDLLTPDEFAADDETRAAYLNFEMEYGLASRLSGRLQKALTNVAASGRDVRESAVAPGYRLFTTHLAPTDPKNAESLNVLREALGVDAVLVVTNNTTVDAKELLFTGMLMEMFGPNPMPRIEGERYIGYREGHNYVSAQMNLGKKGGWIELTDRKEGTSVEDFSGYDRLIATMGRTVAEYLVDEINEE